MADISVYLQTIREAEKGEAVRDAITDALSAMNLIGGNASTLDGHSASYFATANLFSALVGEVGEVDDVLEAIENGLNALKYDMGNFTLSGEGGTFTVDCTGIKGYDNLDVSKFYFELRGASGSKPSGTWTPTQSYDLSTGIFAYTWGAMSADVDVKLWVVKPTKTAIGTAVTELYVNGNGTYDAGNNAAYNPVIVNVPNPIATEILRQEFTRNGHFIINPRSGYTFSEAIIDVNVDRDVKTLISQTFNQNGVYRAIDDKADGYKVVTINVDPKILIDNKRIISNGRYRAIDDGGDGYVDVQVNVPPDADLGHKSIGKNGTYNAEDDDLDGFSSVTVNVPQPVLGSKTITANGTYDPLDEDPKLDGFNSVTVNVPQTSAVLGALIVSQNGTYRASQDNYDGYDVVTVNVESGSGAIEQPIDFDSVDGGGRSTQSIVGNAFTCSFDDTYSDWSINVLALTGGINMTNVDKIKLSCISNTFNGEALIRLYITTVNTYTRGSSIWSSLLSDGNISARLEIIEDGDYEVDTSGIVGVHYIYVVALTGLNRGQQGMCDDRKFGAFDGTLTLSMYRSKSALLVPKGPYIDTGVLASMSNLKIELDIRVMVTSEQAIFGAAWDTSGFFLMTYNDAFRFHSGGAVVDSAVITAGERYKVTATKTGLTVNQTLYSLSNPSGIDSSANVLLFSTNNAQGPNTNCIFYSAKIYDGDTLLKDLVPALDSQGVPCLRDTISDTYLYNSGTGSLFIIE